jgi:hypothetical protein
MRHGTDFFTSPPKEGVLRIFSPLKIRRIRPGLNPRTWVPKASTLPGDHRSRLIRCIIPGNITVVFWLYIYIIFNTLWFDQSHRGWRSSKSITANYIHQHKHTVFSFYLLCFIFWYFTCEIDVELLCIPWYWGLREQGYLSLKRVGEFMLIENLYLILMDPCIVVRLRRNNQPDATL